MLHDIEGNYHIMSFYNIPPRFTKHIMISFSFLSSTDSPSFWVTMPNPPLQSLRTHPLPHHLSPHGSRDTA